MMNEDLKDFLTGKEEVPRSVYNSTLELATLALEPGKALWKFYFLNIVGALVTLAICPQYGFGPFGGEVGFIQKIMHSGPITCGLICGSIFLAGGNILSFIGLNGTERKWVAQHEYAVLTPYVALVFVAGMFLKQFSVQHIHNDVLMFYVSWVVGAILISLAFFKSQRLHFFNQNVY